MKTLLVCLLTLSMLCGAAQAAEKSKTTPSLMNYYKKLVAKAEPAANPFLVRVISREDCDKNEGDHQSCLTTVCATGAFNCRSEYDLNKAVALCKNGLEGECVQQMCETGAYNCRSEYDLNKAVGLCANANGRCVKVVCETGAFNCRSEYDLNKAVNACNGVRGSCVKEMCAMGAYNCRSEYDLNKAISQCKN